jgi:hypothetical protein
MQGEAAPPGAATGQLPFADAAGAAAWLARLPHTNVAQCHAMLAAPARLLPSAPIAPAVKLEVLELMRQPVAAVQSRLAQECRGVPVPLEPTHREILEKVDGLWRAMATGYDSLTDAMTTTAPQLAAQAPLICQRALRYTTLAMHEHWRVHHAVPGVLWQQLHRLYVFSENAGVATRTVSDAVGRASATGSCAGTYVHALLMQLAQPDALTGEQMDIVDRWLERWEGVVGLTPAAAPHSSIPALAVDVASRKGAGFAKDMPAAGARHLNMETLSRTLRQTVAALKQQTPTQLGLGDLPRDVCEKLLLLIHVQWCAAGTGRVDERAPASLKVMISPSLAAMHFHLTGKAFRQPGADTTAADRQQPSAPGKVSGPDDTGAASQRSAAFETWAIVNQSLSGYLGTCRESDVVTRIRHHQLIGLQPPARKGMHVGIVQRLIVDETGTIWIGLRVILGTPRAVAARGVDGAGQFDRALLMPADAARKIPDSILLLPGSYQANRNLLLLSEKEMRIKLQALLDQGPNFERATYSG